MILLADCGATKCNWRILKADQPVDLKTMGYNAVSGDGHDFWVAVGAAFAETASHITQVHFYGAGIATVEIQQRVAQRLTHIFHQALITVHADTVAAARALFGNQKGVVGILGTGSAVCFCDLGQITGRVPSLGFVLGDEGSGAYFGKKLLSVYLRKKLPESAMALFESRFGVITEAEAIERVYRQPNGGRWLATFAPLLLEQYNTDAAFYELAQKGVLAFFQNFGLQNSPNTMRLTGGVAWYLKDLIYHEAASLNVNIDLITQSPMDGLSNYHLTHG